MSLRDLVTFAQNEISHGEPLPPRPEPTSSQSVQPADLTAESNLDIIGMERAPVPDWLRDPDREQIQIGGPSSIIFSEGEFEQPIAPSAGPLHGPDALAYYWPFHFYRKRIWGVYIRTRGILELAAQLKGSPITHGDDPAIQAAIVTLVHHEFFHCSAEAAATRAEVVVRSPVYRPYFYDSDAAAIEEAMANANAHAKLGKVYPTFVPALESWMRTQGPGYSAFHHFIGRRFGKGRLLCSQHIVRFVPPPLMPLPLKLPSDFLVDRAMPKSVPIYVVIDASLSRNVLRPFRKWNGVAVEAHSNDHPPPHIHVEMPPGTPLTRCLWPSLEAYEGDPRLSGKQRRKLCDYLRQPWGQQIRDQLRLVYHDPNLPMPPLS